MTAIATLYRAHKTESETLAVARSLTIGDIRAAYRDYENNFLSVSFYAETHGLTKNYAHLLIETGRKIENGGGKLSMTDSSRLLGTDPNFPVYHLY